MKITEFKRSYTTIDAVTRAAKIFELRKQMDLSVLDGKLREARNCQKEIAKVALEDFETYKTVPFMHYILPRMGLKEILKLMFNSFEFKIYSKFVKRTPEEKQFTKLSRDYYKTLTPEDIKKNTIDYEIPSLY